jgi:hypothetical protein
MRGWACGHCPDGIISDRYDDLLEQEKVDSEGAVEEKRRQEAIHEEVGWTDPNPIGKGVAQLPGVVVVTQRLEGTAFGRRNETYGDKETRFQEATDERSGRRGRRTGGFMQQVGLTYEHNPYRGKFSLDAAEDRDGKERKNKCVGPSPRNNAPVVVIYTRAFVKKIRG